MILPLDGLQPEEQPESFSGFITVDKNHDSNMFFWFFPATVKKLKCLGYLAARLGVYFILKKITIFHRMLILQMLQLSSGYKEVLEGHPYLVY